MLPEPLIKTFQSLLSVETRKLDDQVRAEIGAKVSECGWDRRRLPAQAGAE
jgi:hypothetical protein